MRWRKAATVRLYRGAKIGPSMIETRGAPSFFWGSYRKGSDLNLPFRTGDHNLAANRRYPAGRNFCSLLMISLAVAFAAPSSVLRPWRVNSKSSVPLASNTFVTDALAGA
jgi:hypothetical protein